MMRRNVSVRTLGFELLTDEPNVGFLQYFLWLSAGIENRRLLSIGTQQVGGDAYIYLPLFYFPEEEGDDSAEDDRTPFDDAFRNLADGVGGNLGVPHRAGIYEHRHRQGWPYSFSAWRVPEAQVFVMQDEHDIQFGMDVSLWLFTAEADIPIPLPW